MTTTVLDKAEIRRRRRRREEEEEEEEEGGRRRMWECASCKTSKEADRKIYRERRDS